jgi:hypothetical protein
MWNVSRRVRRVKETSKLALQCRGGGDVGTANTAISEARLAWAGVAKETRGCR